MGDIILVEGENELNVQMVPVPAAVDLAIEEFVVVYSNQSLAPLPNSIEHAPARNITHLGFRIHNNGQNVGNVRIRFWLDDVTMPFPPVEKTPPRNMYFAAIAQPFTVLASGDGHSVSGSTLIIYMTGVVVYGYPIPLPVGYNPWTVKAQITVDDILTAEDTKDFVVGGYAYFPSPF